MHSAKLLERLLRLPRLRYILGKNAKWEAAKAIRSAGFPVVCTEFYCLTNANDMPIDYNFLVDNVKFARSSTYNMSWIQWGPRFNSASMDQYGTNHLYNSDIGFFQTYKDKLSAAGINFWSASTPAITGNSRLVDQSANLYLNCSANAAYAAVRSLTLNTGYSSQKWVVELVSGSNYRIKNVWSGLYVTAGASSGADIKQQALNSSSLAQLFKFPRLLSPCGRRPPPSAGARSTCLDTASPPHAGAQPRPASSAR